MKSKPLICGPTSDPIKSYLFVYNVLSAIAWLCILGLLTFHLSSWIVEDRAVGHQTSIEGLLLSRARSSYGYLGPTTRIVQTFALLEVLHSLLGWVRSPVMTTLMQVSSRLFIVLVITVFFTESHTNPVYAPMVLAWSITEVIRYSYYAASVRGANYDLLTYLRYTTFYVLYPLGASSEAFLILPDRSKSNWSNGTLSNTARLGLFILWWPGLYVMYTHMMGQRRKVLANKVKVI